MPFYTTDRLHIYAEQAGRGPDVLVLNGTGSDLRMKPNIMDSPLTSRFRVTAFDQRGLGQTDKPAGDYYMADYADDAAALMQVLDLNSAMVLGISFGGMVAQELALRHPDRVTRMALFCTAPGGGGGASYPLHELADLDPDAHLDTMIKLNDTRVDDAHLAAHPELRDMARRRTDLSAYAGEADWAEGRRKQLAARAGHDCWARLENIACPVWLAGGLYDGIAKPDTMRGMAARLPDARLDLYEGGHLFMLQDGKVFPDLLAFFGEDI